MTAFLTNIILGADITFRLKKREDVWTDKSSWLVVYLVLAAHTHTSFTFIYRERMVNTKVCSVISEPPQTSNRCVSTFKD